MIKKVFVHIRPTAVVLLALVIAALLPETVFAAAKSPISSTAPDIVKNIYNALDSIRKWMLIIATPAAAVGVISGVFIKKFSFGDEERMITGRKLVKNSLAGYGVAVSTGLILTAIEKLLT